MFNKKGAVGFVIEYVQALALLFLILMFFLSYFFVLGGANASSVIIKGEDITAAPKIVNILNTKIIDVNPEKTEFASLTYYDLLIKAYISGKDEDAKKFNELLKPLLRKMTMPNQDTKCDYGWSFEPKTESSFNLGKIKYAFALDKLKTSVVMQGGEEKNLGFNNPAISYHESLMVPFPDKTAIVFELSFQSLGCSEEYTRSYI